MLHTFTLLSESEIGAELPITAQMARCILNALNSLENDEPVVQLPVNEFEDTFLVSMASHSEILKKEFQEGIITHIAHVSLRCDEDRVMYGLWKRLKSSAVLV